MNHFDKLVEEDPEMAMRFSVYCDNFCDTPLSADLLKEDLAKELFCERDSYEPPTGYCPKRTKT